MQQTEELLVAKQLLPPKARNTIKPGGRCLKSNGVFFWDSRIEIRKGLWEMTRHIKCCLMPVGLMHVLIHSSTSQVGLSAGLQPGELRLGAFRARVIQPPCELSFRSFGTMRYQIKDKWRLMFVLSHAWLCDPTDYSPPGSSVHGILQARILEWVAIPFSRGSSRPRNQTWISCIANRFFIIWALGE